MKKLLFLLAFMLVAAFPSFAADSTSFDPTKVIVQSLGASIPVGTVITWPSNLWPSDKDNLLECNVQSISSTVYPELVAVVGGTSRIIKECSSGDVEDRPAITMALLTTRVRG